MKLHRMSYMIALACLALTTFAPAAPGADRPEVAAAKRGCDANQASDCYRLGTFYREGKIVDQDDKKASRLFKKSCDAGELKACRELGVMYKDGDGLDRARAKAGMLLQKVCKGGDGETCFDLAHDPADYGLDQSRVAALYEQACDAGFPKGCFNAGLQYERGKQVPKDMIHALALYEKGCAVGDMAACYNAGSTLTEGDGVPKNPSHGMALLTKACQGPVDPGSKDTQPNACFNLGVIYQRGEGVAQDFTRAKTLFEKACQAGLSDACTAAENTKSMGEHAKAVALDKQPGHACQVVSPEEAASVLGPNPKSVSSTEGCTYQVPGHSMQLVVRSELSVGGWNGLMRQKKLLNAKRTESQDESEHMEPTLGEDASSLQRSDSFYLSVVVKGTLVEIELRDKGKVVPSALFEKVRVIAKQAASRL
jgi:TPR repeat protein